MLLYIMKTTAQTPVKEYTFLTIPCKSLGERKGTNGQKEEKESYFSYLLYINMVFEIYYISILKINKSSL